MACDFLCLKKSKAPIVYVFLKAIILIGISLLTKSLTDTKDLTGLSLFWAISFLALALYIYTYKKDPGFISHESIYFTDQEEIMQSEKRNRSIYSKQESEMKLKVEEKKEFESPEADVTVKIEQSQKDHTDPRLVARKLKFQEIITLPNASTSERSPEFALSKNSKQQIQTEILPSVFTKHETEFVSHEFELTQKDNIEPINLDKPITKDEIITRPQSRSEIPEIVVECEPSDDNIIDMSKEMHESDIHHTSIEQEISNKYSQREHVENDNMLTPKASESLNQNEHINQIKIPISNDPSCHSGFAPFNEDNMNSRSDFSKHNPSNQSKMQLHFVENKNLDTYQINPPTDVTVPDSDSKRKQERENIDLSKSPESPHSQPGDELLIVEHRYCTVCNIEQPLRSKHCQDCNRCIASYDHHCPWVGNCIGQNNHLVFYWYLIFEFIEISWAEIVLAISFNQAEDFSGEDVLKGFFMILNGYFFLMVGGLVFFHTYLIFVNLTTWEKLSWNKITYLQEWNLNWGYPFSRGTIKNVIMFCCNRKKEIFRWNMPRYKGPINKKNRVQNYKI